MRDWITTTIGEFIDFNPSEKLQKNKIAKKIPMDKLGTFERKIKGFVFIEYQSGPKFRNNDTLVAKITPCLENGKTAFVNILDNEEVAFGSSEFIVLRNNKLSDAKFIYYLARSPYFREKAISCMEGTSGRKRVNETALKHLNIKVPPIETQQKIAKILSDIDDKIEILHQINDNLAELAKTIYDYWFVQFDFPDQNGKPYKTSGGKMVYNEVLKREIPEGWEVKKLGEVIEKISNNILPTEYQNLNYLPIDFLPKRQFYYDKYDLRENALSSLIKFDEDDILLGAMRVYFHRVCNAIEDGISRNTIFVLRPFEKENKNYCLFLLDEEKTIQFANDNSTGSSIPYAKWDNGLANYQLVLPKKNILSLFNLKINPIIKKLKINSKQIQHLRSLRDWLLPMLMNGQISVE